MRSPLAVLSVSLFVATGALAGCGETETAENPTGQVTATGQVVCLVCYSRNTENIGSDHDSGRECALACIKWEGNPAGLVASDGRVYQFAGGLVANNNEKISSYIARTVTVTGDAYEKDGMLMLSADDVVATDSQ